MSVPLDGSGREASLAERYRRIRDFSMRLAGPLSEEDCVVQSMPDASPVKWHLAHTTWFFETFVLATQPGRHRPYREGWAHLFNSYYEAFGSRHPRPRRGMLTRPSLAEVRAYRHAVDEQIQALLEGEVDPKTADCLELGLNHEQQHQELILTDVLNVLSANPLGPAYDPAPPPALAVRAPEKRWIEHPGGLVTIGHDGKTFAYDNERPAHKVYVEPFSLSSRHVTNAEFQAFIGDNGYQRPELWLSDGWAKVTQGWDAPLYWERRDGAWQRFSLYGWIAIDPHAPVSHVSYYEADAYARWAGLRLPTEVEWELVARDLPADGQFVDDGAWVPVSRDVQGVMGGVWSWTASPYVPYPGFVPLEGAAGEYNGKFMANQLVLRGGSCFTSRDHLRPSYRNFFYPDARWQMSGIRLART